MRPLFVAISLMTLASGCSTTGSLQAATRLEILPSRDFRVSDVRVGNREGALEVTGAVRRLHPQARALGAHLIVEALRGDESLARKRAWWSVMSMHRRPGGRFNSRLPGDALRADQVRIAIYTFHRRDAEQDNQND